MDNNVQPLVDAYDQAQKAGKGVISKSWKSLQPETQSWLFRSGYYSERGGAVSDLPEDGVDMVEALEYHLGNLALCSEAVLPARNEQGAQLPPEACKNEVPASISEMLVHPYGLEPYFLRLALHAIRKHEMANLMERLPVLSGFSAARNLGKLAFVAFSILLLLLSPIVVAVALSSAFTGNQGDTAVALYGLGFIVCMLSIAKDIGKETPDSTPAAKDEQTYRAWEQLSPYGVGYWSLLGAGAFTYFEDMQSKGLRVPLIAFDIAAALKAKVLPV